MAKWSLINCAEEHGTNSESFSIDGVKASVRLRVDWANRYLLAGDILGRVHPRIGALRARSATVVDDKAAATTDLDAQVLDYTYALVQVEYDSKVTEDLYTERLEKAISFITLDPKDYRWRNAAGDVLQDAEAPGKQIEVLKLSRSEPLVNAIHSDHLSVPGKVNDVAYTSAILGLTFDPETLLMEAPVVERTVASDGTERYNLAKTFLYRENGWNKFWRAKTGQWEEIWSVALGAVYKNYPVTSFTNVLV